MGEIFIQTKGIFRIGRFRLFRRVEGNRTVNQSSQTFQFHLRATDTDIGINARNIPEATAFFHQVGKAPLNQDINHHALLIGIDRIVIDSPHRDFAEIDQRAAVQRTKIGGLQMDHKITIIQPIFGLGIEGDKVILLFTFTWHHADIVSADQRIQPGNTCQRSFWRHQPELRLFAQRIFHIGLDADLHFNLTQIVAQTDILHRSDFNALIANRCATRNNAIRRHKIDGDGIASILITPPN